MKNYFLIIFSLIFTLTSFGQDFKPSKDYRIIGMEFEKRMNFDSFISPYGDTMVATLINTSDPNIELNSYFIQAWDLYDSVYVKEWVNPGYKNVERILWVQFEFAACCYDYQVHYYIVTKKGDFVALPSIYFSMCDYPGEIEEYEYHPDNNIFHRVVNTYVKQDSIGEYMDVETLFWDGKELQSPDH